jgi:hypothetical protein
MTIRNRDRRHCSDTGEHATGSSFHSVAHVKREVPQCLRVIEPLSGNTKLAHGRSRSGSLAIFARCPSPRVACGAYRTRSPGVAVSSQLTNVAIAGSFSEGAQLANSLSSCGS